MTEHILQGARILEALERLTAQGEAVWLKRTVDPEAVLCFVAGELLVFNLHFGIPEDEPLPDPLPSPAGVSAHVRNLTFLWLPSIDGWERVSAMLSYASVDERSFDELQNRCYDHTVNYFESLAGRA